MNWALRGTGRTHAPEVAHGTAPLATIPLYVRAGAVIPTGPVRQYDGDPVEGNALLMVYPGADGSSTL